MNAISILTIVYGRVDKNINDSGKTYTVIKTDAATPGANTSINK